MSGNTKYQLRWHGGVIKRLRHRRFTANAWVDSNHYRSTKMIVDICPNKTLQVTYPDGRMFVHKNLTLADARELVDAAFAADLKG